MTVKEHYDKHLGNFYAWMSGDFEKMQASQELFFKDIKIAPFSVGTALDLGCGHGLQSISLAKLGFSVKAIDFNRHLLDQLSARTENFNIEIIEHDILSFLDLYSSPVELIVCMGDTLTHLESITAVERLIKRSADNLITKGKMVISFRDLTLALTDTQRFIPVRSDDTRILTCFLEYYADFVLVHDILHERENGEWKLKISAYPKLRINEKILTEIFHRNKLALLQTQIINRMTYLVAEKN